MGVQVDRFLARRGEEGHVVVVVFFFYGACWVHFSRELPSFLSRFFQSIAKGHLLTNSGGRLMIASCSTFKMP